jgi:hypothetical protein
MTFVIIVIVICLTVYGILFSDETGNKMMVQTLSRPEIKGFAMKQTTDYILPPDT